MTGRPDSPLVDPDIGRALEAAALAIGHLEARTASSPARRAWLRRSTFAAAVRGLEADGYQFEVERLFALAANLPVPRVKDFGIDAAALEILGRLIDMTSGPEGTGMEERPPSPPKEELDRAVEAIRLARPAGAVLLGAVEGLRRWVADDGRPSLGLGALARVLAERGITREPVAWLAGAIPSRAIMTDGLSAARWVRRALHEVEASAGTGSRALAALEATREVWHRRLGARRSTSRLGLVIELALAYPILSPVQVSRLLGTSVRGAAKLMDELADLQILTAPRRHGTWRFFIASDLQDIRSHLLGETPLPQGRSLKALPPAPDPLPPVSRPAEPIAEPTGFADLLAAADQAIHRVASRLGRYRRRPPGEYP